MRMPPSETDAIKSLNPKAQFSHSWDGTRTWLPEHTGTKPTDTEIANELKRLTDIYDDEAYQRIRKVKYPNIGDQLDNLYKDILAGKVDSTGEFAKAIKAVKDAHPKP